MDRISNYFNYSYEGLLQVVPRIEEERFLYQDNEIQMVPQAALIIRESSLHEILSLQF